MATTERLKRASGEDCADALRYLMATKLRTIEVRKLRRGAAPDSGSVNDQSPV